MVVKNFSKIPLIYVCRNLTHIAIIYIRINEKFNCVDFLLYLTTYCLRLFVVWQNGNLIFIKTGLLGNKQIANRII